MQGEGKNECFDISVIYTDKRVQRYVLAQIQQAGMHIRTVDKTHVVLELKVPCPCQLYNHQITSISFLVVLTQGFPAVAPRVHLKSNVLSPNTNEVRDLLKNILHEEWNLKSRLEQITAKAQHFISAFASSRSKELRCSIGVFHLGKQYWLSVLREQKCDTEYMAIQHIEDSVSVYLWLLTPQHFLCFKPICQPSFQGNRLMIPREQEIDQMTLIFYTHLHCLKEVLMFSQIKSKLTLRFQRDNRDNKGQQTSQVWIKTVKIIKSNRFLVTLLKAFRKMPVKITLDIDQNAARTQERELLEQIQQKENTIRQHFNLETVDSLNKAYQNAVQYYSSKQTAYYQIFLRQIACLYGRKDVRLIIGC